MIPKDTPAVTGVIVDNPELVRHGQAGHTVAPTTIGTGKAAVEAMDVRFDVDGETEAVPLADLKRP